MSSSSSSLTDLLLPAYKQMLTNLSAWLDKAVEGIENNTEDNNKFLSGRLASDMFPLATQVRFVCLQSQEAIYRLQGKELPPSLLELAQEGRTAVAGDSPGTLVEAKERIEEALAFLEALEPDVLDKDGCADRTISLELPGGMIFDLNGAQYVRDWALPQFYFHLVVAYSILRNAGVDLGKSDYVPHMFKYLRPGGTMPAPAQEEQK